MDGWNSVIPYVCEQNLEDFDPGPPPTGNDATWLHDPFDDLNGAQMVAQLNNIASTTTAAISCGYHSNLSSDHEIILDETDPSSSDYAVKVADFRDKYEACKGAIGTVVASFPFNLETNDCTFD